MLREQLLLHGNKKMFLLKVKNIFAFWSQILHMFLGLAKIFPSNGELARMADGEVEVEEPQMGHRKGKGKKERTWKGVTHFLIWLLFVA